MLSTTVMSSIGILVGSFAVGIAFYYVLDPNTKQIKKQRLDDLLSMIIQFIIYLWLAKIVLQFPTLLESPLTVLAYPSNSSHFYLATVLWLIHLAYKYRKQEDRALSIFQSFSIVMVTSFLMYEFLQIIMNDYHHINVYFICLSIIVLCYVLLYQRADSLKLAFSLFGCWLLLAGSMSFVNGYFMLFQFLLKPIYFIALLILLLLFSYRALRRHA